METRSILTGMAIAGGMRALLPRALKLKFDRDAQRLIEGDPAPLLKAYAHDAVLHFAPGEHRWAGDWVGRPAIERFLQSFVAARIQGEIKQLALSGPPWALTIWARFDDHSDAPDGTRLYENRTVLVLRTRWGKVVDHEDFYIDTARIADFDRKLTELGIAPAPA